MFNIDRWRARFRWLDAVLTFNERFGAIGGGALSASIGLAAFLSLFPLLLVSIAVVGFISSGDSTFTSDLIANLNLKGRSAELVTDAISTAQGSRRTASLVGLAGLLWSGLGVVGSMQTALNTAWQTRGRGIIDKAVALSWLLGAAVLLSANVALGPVLQLVPGPVMVGAILLGLLLTTVLFVWTYTYLGNQPVPWRAHLPGAVLVAVGFEILKVVGSIYVPRAVASSSALYGTLGVVFAVLAWLLIYARLIVYGAVLNVMRWEASCGTDTVDLEVPHMGGDEPLSATRGGAIDERAEDDADQDEGDGQGALPAGG